MSQMTFFSQNLQAMFPDTDPVPHIYPDPDIDPDFDPDVMD